MNYFELFLLPKQFQIDIKILNKNYYKLQLKFHPDLFINNSKYKQNQILEKSIEINKGYEILKNSLNRSIYLLSLNGINTQQKNLLSDNPSFLKKYFFLYEELESIKTKNNLTITHIDKFLKKIKYEIKYCENKINYAFNEKKWNKVIYRISQLRFLNKILINLKK
ncbi:Co-chaperone protein HscB [Buchnera aphidicola (Protaphis terricola)]|uniref:Fe-S protein assembly co-chaperone HscB n=1 Tax=Buchnera aphidicola TaxID=9 RepID=UPI00346461DC